MKEYILFNPGLFHINNIIEQYFPLAIQSSFPVGPIVLGTHSDSKWVVVTCGSLVTSFFLLQK